MFFRWRLLLGVLILSTWVTGQTTRPVETRLLHFTGGATRAVIPLETAGTLLFAKMNIDGKKDGWFWIDTGSSMTAVDTSVAESLKLAPATSAKPDGGPVPRKVFRVGRLACGAVEFDPIAIGGIDLHQFSSMMNFPVAGILGSDLLGQSPFEVDYAKRTLTIFDPATFSPPQAKEIPLLVDGTPSTTITIEGCTVDAAIDTGGMNSALSPVVSLDHPRLLAGKPRWDVASLEVSGVHKDFECRLDPVSFLGRSPRPVWFSCARDFNTKDDVQTVATTIGAEELFGGCLTFDYRGKRMWAKWPPPPTTDQMLAQLGDARGHDLMGMTPLMRAASLDRTDVAARLLERGADVNAVDAVGRTALMTAASSDESGALMRLLLDHGARTDVSMNIGALTALDYACDKFNAKVVKELLAAGADPNAKDTRGWTPLKRAVQGNQLPIIQALLAAGADPLVAANDGNSPFLLAANTSSAAILKAMLDKLGGRAAGARDLALAGAAYGERLENVKVLLDAGADVNGTDADGMTPLMLTDYNNSGKIARLLLAHGADPSRRSKAGKTAWDYAAANGNLVILRALGGPPRSAVSHR